MSLNSSELPPPLSGKDKNSFAFTTLSYRLPVIITKIIDLLCRQRKVIPVQLSLPADSLQEAEEETKTLIEELARLKYELQTNKPLQVIESTLSDTEEWNKVLKEQELESDSVTYFNVSWLYAECYLYRRIREVFASSNYFKNFDPFSSIKQDSFKASLRDANVLASKLTSLRTTQDDKILQEQFNFFVMTSLLGNKCDLSISCGELNEKAGLNFEELKSKILVNETAEIFHYVLRVAQSERSKYRIDVILDNAGFELLTDYCLVEFLHSSLLPKEKCTVVFHVKKMPWFVSDTMIPDIEWMEKFISESDQCSSELKQVSKTFGTNFKQGCWIVREHDFWTLPQDYSEMSNVAPELYREFCQSDLLIFKGDLNYRKLVGDLQWNFTTPFRDSLRKFQPNTALCSLRTVKADVVVGIDSQTVQRIHSDFPEHWMENGEYALIHFLNNKI